MSPARVPNLSPDDLHRLLPVATQVEDKGHGGQKQVFKAILNGQAVAIKVVLPDGDSGISPIDVQASTVVLDAAATTVLDNSEEGGGDPEDDLIPPRLRREVNLLASIDSPTVVPLVEIAGKRLRALTDGGKVYLAYAEAWVDGEDLDRRLNKGRATMPQPEVLRLALDAVSGIGAMWKQEIVHRDIKPHNIIRRSAGGFVLVDLGLALDIQADTITETGAWLGTPVFAAPEINDPELRDRVDFRADQFSLGLVLYEALAAQHPYQARTGGRTVTDVRQKFRQRPILLSDAAPTVDPDFATVIMRMIDTDMNLRYARLGQLELALRAIANHLGVTT